MKRSEFNQKVDDFIGRYIDKTVGYPTGSYVGECLSVVKWYMKDLWGFNPPASGNNSAYGYWTNFPAPLGDYFDKIANTPTGVPQKGDVVVWKGALSGSNGYGHIAIATGKGDTNSFEAFGQNWGGKHGHHVTYKYTNVYGWLRPKNIDDPESPPPPPVTPPPTVDPKDAQITDLQTQLTACLSKPPVEVTVDKIVYQDSPETLTALKNALDDASKAKGNVKSLTEEIKTFKDNPVVSTTVEVYPWGRNWSEFVDKVKALFKR